MKKARFRRVKFNRQLDTQKDWSEGWTDGRIDKQALTAKRTNGHKDRLIVGQIQKDRLDGRTDGQKYRKGNRKKK